MDKYTIVASRGMSKVLGVKSKHVVGQVIRFKKGSHTDQYNQIEEQKEIFYWREADFLAVQADEIIRALASPQFLGFSDTVTNTRKIVLLKCFNQGEINRLKGRGEIPEKLGGVINFSHFEIIEV